VCECVCAHVRTRALSQRSLEYESIHVHACMLWCACVCSQDGMDEASYRAWCQQSPLAGRCVPFLMYLVLCTLVAYTMPDGEPSASVAPRSSMWQAYLPATPLLLSFPAAFLLLQLCSSSLSCWRSYKVSTEDGRGAQAGIWPSDLW